VITVHRLLKNNIAQDEYILLSGTIGEEAFKTPNPDAWLRWNKGSISYDIGDVHYAYASLQPVYAEIPEPELSEVKRYRSESPMVYTIDIQAPMELVYEALIDLNQRVEWMAGLKAVKIKEASLNRLNRICTSFECAMEHEKCTWQTSKAEFGERSLQFSETLLEHPMTFNYMVEDMKGTIKLTLECHHSFRLPMKWAFDWFMKKKFKADTQKSLNQLKVYCENKTG
jgi:uncharacterized protein YndB with AHSA1/START domain